jgi:hypothetical protein
MSATISVRVPLFNEVEVLGACGPFDVFSVASRAAARDRPGVDVPFRVITITISAEPS